MGVARVRRPTRVREQQLAIDDEDRAVIEILR